MFAANISLASGATHAGGFALLSHLSLLPCGVLGRDLRDAHLTVLACLANLHSRTAGWPLVGLRLPFDPSVWMSHTTSQAVQTPAPVVVPPPIPAAALRARFYLRALAYLLNVDSFSKNLKLDLLAWPNIGTRGTNL